MWGFFDLSIVIVPVLIVHAVLKSE